MKKIAILIPFSVLLFLFLFLTPLFTLAQTPSPTIIAKLHKIPLQSGSNIPTSIIPLESEPWRFYDGESTEALAFGDLDRDGDLDVLFGNSNYSSTLLLNDGNGFSLAQTEDPAFAFDANLTSETSSVAMGDLNNDGYLDLVIGYRSFVDFESVYLNQGDGTFDSAPTWTSSLSLLVEDLALADLDMDGFLDLIVVSGDSIYIYYSTGSTTPLFNEPSGPDVTIDGISQLSSLDVADVNLDGWVDVVVGVSTGSNSAKIYVFSNDSGSIDDANPENMGINEDSDVYDVILGDLNEDGFADLVAGTDGGFRVYTNVGDGLYDIPTMYTAYTGTIQSLDLGDVDGDGDLELAVGYSDGVANRVFHNFNGKLVDSQNVWESDDASDTYAVRFADVDGDSDLDLVAGNLYGSNMIYYNTGAGLFPKNGQRITQFTPHITDIEWGDLDGDGDMDLLAGIYNDYNYAFMNESGYLNEFATGWSTDMADLSEALALGDADGDGDLDLATANGANDTIVYLNQNGNFEATWTEPTFIGSAQDVAWADMDGDGFLDLVLAIQGNGVEVWHNTGDWPTDPFEFAWQSPTGANVVGVAIADMDDDGDLDIATASQSIQGGHIYVNEGTDEVGILNFSEIKLDEDTGEANDVAWGDIDGDGDPDLGFAIDGYSLIYENVEGNFYDWLWSSDYTENSLDIDFVDVDGDGDLDVSMGNKGTIGNGYSAPNRLYLNEQGSITFESVGSFGRQGSVIAWGDMDRDGDMDAAMVESASLVTQHSLLFFRNRRPADENFAGSPPPSLSIELNGGPATSASGELITILAPAENSSVSMIRNGVVPISYTVYHPAGLPFSEIRAYYSTDGGDNWQTAVATSGTTTENISTTPIPDPNTYCRENINLPISQASVVTSNLSINNNHQLADLNLFVTATHQSISDFTFTLIHKQTQTRASIIDRVGVTPNNPSGCYLGSSIATFLDDEATYTVENSCEFGLSGKLRPSHPLWVFDNETAGGEWLLRVENHQQDGPDANLESWCVEPSYHQTHIFNWDIAASGLFGKTDNLVFRLEAIPAFDKMKQSDSFQRPYFSAQTNPFRVSGNQIQVLWDTDGFDAFPVDDAIIYRLPSGGETAVPLTNASGDPYETNGQGFLQGNAPVEVGDTLYALWPWRPDVYRNPYPVEISNVAQSVVTSTLTISDDDGIVADVNIVNLRGFHPNIGALKFILQSPSGRRVEIMTDTCDGYRDFDLNFNDEANPGLPRCPLVGGSTYQPENPLGAFDGENVNGDWHLVIESDGTIGIGVLFDWGLELQREGEPENDRYTLYVTNGTPTEAGLDGDLIVANGLQTLYVDNHVLMVFDLTISLEWDPRYDEAYLEKLEEDILRASEVLFDVSDGQVALGQVDVYMDKENWVDAEVVIKAANNIRPSATLGGDVTKPISDVISATKIITEAYVPGQISMGPTWGRYGDPDSDLGEDWARTLAHELSHFFLFIPDNYLGIRNQNIVATDCYGSFMTDVYSDEYSEYLTRSGWVGDCLETIADEITYRTDWETILQFYPWLSEPETPLNGPIQLPLNLTSVQFHEPDTETEALEVPFFSLRKEDNSRLYVPVGQGQGFLYKNWLTPTAPGLISGTYVVALGTPIGDQMQARGAEPGDRLCIYDLSQDNFRLGCIVVGDRERPLPLNELPDWKPQVQVTFRTTDSVWITMTHNTALTDTIYAQILPSTGALATFPLTSTVHTLTTSDGLTFSRLFTLPHPTLSGFVRVWADGSDPARESMTQYFLGEGWGASRVAWGASRVAWGASRVAWGASRVAWGASRVAWGAPVTSGDGQVTIYNVNDLFGDSGVSSLQALNFAPDLPIWLTPLGQAFRFEASTPVTRNIAFNYMQNAVPGGNSFEELVRVYYSPDEGTTWQRLPTEQDTIFNLATAKMPLTNNGEGIYLLASTVAMPQFSAGWNNFGYPILETRPLTTALASIEGSYTAVYHFDWFGNSWHLYDTGVLTEHPDLAPLVNDLSELEFGQGYWLHATEAITAYFGLADDPNTSAPLIGIQPPATFFGEVNSTSEFTPSAGMVVTAVVNSTLCGQTIVQEYNGQLVYVMQVDSASWQTCGKMGDPVTFFVDGQQVAQTHEWQNSQANYHPLAPALAPQTPTLLSISASVSAVTLDWTDHTPNTSYEVWRSTTPYFTPATSGAVLVTTTTTSDYVDFGVSGNVYYLVRGVNGVGETSALSNRMGLFTFAIVPGTP